MSRWPAWATTRVEQARGFSQRLVDARIIQSSLILAAQAFLALFPLIIVIYAIVPPGTSTGLVNYFRRHLGLTGSTSAALQRLLLDRSGLQQNLSVISAILVLLSATAFTRALQRVYEGVWELPKLGLRGAWRWLAWITVLAIYLSFVGFIVHIVGVREVSGGISLVLGFLLWWWTPFLLLGGRVTWRALLPGAVITTVIQFVFYLGSTILMPRVIRNSESDYGPVGVLFSVESWLVVFAGVIVVGAALGAMAGQSQSKFGIWVRGNSDPDGWRRTPQWVRRAEAKQSHV